jgi:hypothetical protein
MIRTIVTSIILESSSFIRAVTIDMRMVLQLMFSETVEFDAA